MSDYGDYDEYEDADWLYVEDEYMPADDLAEHAVQSPPPTAYDEDQLEEWDRFDYFNDIEYASDGYDDVNLETKNGPGDTKVGQKRKRGAAPSTRSRKRHQPVKAHTIGQGDADMLTNAPVVWRSQADRETSPKIWNEDTGSYALLKDWREKLVDAPKWTRQSSHAASPAPTASQTRNATSSSPSKPPPAANVEPLVDEEQEDEDENTEGAALDPAAIMAILQQRLAAEGGPLSGMDPEQVLQFAMRMANGEDAGDDVAGEMADEMLEKMMGEGSGDDEDADADVETNLKSWVAQQRNPANGETSNHTTTTYSKAAAADDVVVEDTTMHEEDTPVSIPTPAPVAAKPQSAAPAATKRESRKRKAAAEVEIESEAAAPTATGNKRRATTRSYQTPTAASQAKSAAPAASTRTTRSTRSTRSSKR